MVDDPSGRKLAHVMSLSAEETHALAAVQTETVAVAKGTDLVRQGEPESLAYVLRSGWAMRYRHLRDGRRQIVNLLLPGDWAGLTSVMFDEADHSVCTVTDAVVSPVPTEELLELLQHHARLLFGVCWTAAQEEAVIAEHLVNVGRRSAYERMGHLFLELLLRSELIGAVRDGSFDFPLSQVDLADALGLSQVHVNRTLQRLRSDGLIRLNGRRAAILDQRALERTVGFESAYLHLAGLPIWLRRRLAKDAA